MKNSLLTLQPLFIFTVTDHIFGYIFILFEETFCELFQIFKSNHFQHVCIFFSRINLFQKILVVEEKCGNNKVCRFEWSFQRNFSNEDIDFGKLIFCWKITESSSVPICSFNKKNRQSGTVIHFEWKNKPHLKKNVISQKLTIFKRERRTESYVILFRVEVFGIRCHFFKIIIKWLWVSKFYQF